MTISNKNPGSSSNFWERKLQGWKLDNFNEIDVKKDLKRIDTLTSLLKKKNDELNTLKNCLNHLRCKGHIGSEKIYVNNQEIEITEGLLFLCLFLNPASSPKSFREGLSDILQRVSCSEKDDEIKSIKKSVDQKRLAIDNMLSRMYKEGYADIHWAKYNKSTRGPHGGIHEPSYPLYRIISSTYSNKNKIIQEISFLNKAKTRKDAVMLLIEETKPMSTCLNSESNFQTNEKSLLLLHHSSKLKIDYLKNKWAFPIIKVPAFSNKYFWNYDLGTTILDSSNAVFQDCGLPKIAAQRRELYLPAGNIGSLTGILGDVSTQNEFIEKYEEFLCDNVNKKIKNGPALYDKIQYFTYDDLWEKHRSELYFRTLFFVACVEAKKEKKIKEQEKILKIAKDEMSKQFNDQGEHFQLLYHSNKGHAEHHINPIKDAFENILNPGY